RAEMRLRRPGMAAIGLALTTVLVGLVGLVAVNAMATQTVQQEHTYPFNGTQLSVEAALGSVQIVPGEPGQIVVRRRETCGLPRDLDVEVRTVGGAITVSGLSGKVKLTSESGEVRASGPSGKLVTLRSHDGRVTAQNISSAQVVATSDNQAVQLTFRSPPALVVGRSQ